MIEPLWGGVSEIDFYLRLLAKEVEEGKEAEKAIGPLDAVKETFTGLGGKDWTSLLRDGFLGKKVLTNAPLTVDNGKVSAALASAEMPDLPYPESIDIHLTTGANYDGRFANNGWLQEAPDPITKLTWDNAALISIKTAKVLDLEDEDLIELSREGCDPVVVPVLKSPGHAEYSLSIPVGFYGKEKLGRVCDGVGFDAYPLRKNEDSCVVSGVTIKKLDRKHELAITAEHYSMEGRAIVREGTVAMYEEEHDFAQHQGMDAHIPPTISLYQGPDYLGQAHNSEEINEANQKWTLDGREFRIDPLHQWAKAIDLNACTGCNSCVIACQAENNIPIVGKNQVLAGARCSGFGWIVISPARKIMRSFPSAA